jgi:hypothetical protein
MNSNQTLTIIAVLGLGSASAALAQQNQNELKQRVLAQAQSLSPDDYSFTRAIRSELKSFRAENPKRRIPGYYRLAGYLGTPATASTDSHGRTGFHFATCRKTPRGVLDTDVSPNTTADAAVSEAGGVPFIEQVHLTVRPMRIKLLMKLDKYESIARYHVGPEGKPLLMEQTSDMSGSGMGQEGRAHTLVTYSDYRAVSKQR